MPPRDPALNFRQRLFSWKSLPIEKRLVFEKNINEQIFSLETVSETNLRRSFIEKDGKKKRSNPQNK